MRDLQASLPSIEELDKTQSIKTTRILSADGKLVATLFRENFKPVAYDEMGENIVNAVIAIEDRRFLDHGGVDFRGVARAAVGNLMSGQIEQGASTITMQLARHLYLSDERSYERKVREALLAQKMEEKYGKEEILERYLNEVYFGSGAIGIGAAASRYYGTTPKNLTVAQSAMLAALIQSPSFLNPLTNHQGARHRQVQVLTAMRDLRFITPKQFREALDEATAEDFKHSTAGQPMLKYPYFTSYVAKQLVDSQGEELVYQGGLTVRTTLDRALQSKVQSILRETVQADGPHYGVKSAAAVVIENETGRIRAMVGGLEWRSGDQFNRAWQAQRQPGSTFKPLLYAAALELGYNQNSVLRDKAVKLTIDEGNGRTRTWTPINSDGTERGEIPMREALRLSRNQATIDLSTRVGIPRLVDLAERFGIESELPNVPSLALGTGVVTPLEMAEAYTVLANQGVKRESTPILTVTDPNGRLLSNKKQTWSYQATSPEVATQTTDMLRRVVLNGTGRAAHVPNLDTVGKTGTTDSYKDAWFIGYTPRYTICVWMGNDDNTPTYRLYGGSLPAQAWRRIALSLNHDGAERFDFLAAKPHKVKYCRITRQLAGESCSKTEAVQFRSEPPRSGTCDICLKTRRFKFSPGDDTDTLQRDVLDVAPDYPTAAPRIL